ncbi:hypothetical protein JTB14_017831 [Gonioctena quinquepunctata]|nr:hypothetical protein JTB14_017831 [Gonioctena quinquepunctata]
MWTIVNERVGRKNVRKEIKLKINDEIITDQKVMCHSFVTHSATTVSEKLDIHFGGDLPTSCSSPDSVTQSMYNKSVTEKEVIEIIDGLKNKNPTGFDGIPIKLLKYCKTIISQPIATSINHSFELGQFPDSLKLGKVIPLYKRGDQ